MDLGHVSANQTISGETLVALEIVPQFSFQQGPTMGWTNAFARWVIDGMAQTVSTQPK